MKKLIVFVVTLFLAASFAWGQAASPTSISKVALDPQPLPPGNQKTAITMRKAGGQQQELNPQPLPPGKKVELNPQPLPPRVNSNALSKVAVNPQPLPPGQSVSLNPQPFPPGPSNTSATTSAKGNLSPGTKVGFNPQPDPPAVQKHMNASTTKLY